jgi:uncharacterized protein (TIGR03437 family)
MSFSFITEYNYLNGIGSIPNTINNNKCRKYKPFLPNFSPIINSISASSSSQNTYSLVYINGENFLPPAYGTTFIKFGNNSNNLPIVFYSSTNISFVIPLNATKGIYEVTVVNVYNSNFSPSINSSNPGILNYSNKILYTIT